MAQTKRFLDKATYMLVVGIWNLVSSYLLNLTVLQAEIKLLVIGIGNLVIVWVGIESGHVSPNGDKKPLTS